MSWFENNIPQNTGENSHPDISERYAEMHQEKKEEIILNAQAKRRGFIKTSNLPSLGVSVPHISDIYPKSDGVWRLTFTASNDLPSRNIQKTLNDDAETWWFELRYESKANKEFWFKYSVLTAKGLGEEEKSQLIDNFSSKLRKIPSFTDLYDSLDTSWGQRIDWLEAWYMEQIYKVGDKNFQLSASIWWYGQIHGNFWWKDIQDAIHDWLDKVTYDDLEYKKISWLSLWIAWSAHILYNLDDTFSLYTSLNWKVNIIWPVKDTGELQVLSWINADIWKGFSLNLGLVWNYVNNSSGHDVIDYIEQDSFTEWYTWWIQWENKNFWIALQTADTIKWRQDVNDTSMSVYVNF